MRQIVGRGAADRGFSHKRDNRIAIKAAVFGCARRRWQAGEAVAAAAAETDFATGGKESPARRVVAAGEAHAPPFLFSHASLSRKREEGGGAAGQSRRALCAS